MDAMEEYLKPTFTIDCDNGKIVDTAKRLTARCSSDSEKAVALFYFVRDEISYNLYMSSTYEEDFIASRILDWGKGYCVQKAVLLAALGRAARIPSRLAFAKIRNHRVPEKIVQFIGDNVFPRHGYTQFFLDGGWLSVAATFDKKLCEKNGFTLVEFNGTDDAMLPEKDREGRPYIEYLEKYGPQSDLPFQWIYDEITKFIGTDKRPWFSEKDAL